MVKTGGLMQVHHVAEILACSSRHVRNLVKRKELEAIRVGNGRYNITRESVMKFMDENRIESENYFP
jgi:excisionase family DNA binding protein